MAKGFNLTAELNLRGPGNLKQIASAIRREIGTIDATVKVKLDKSAERSILNTSNALARLNKELQITAQSSALTTNNITGLVGAINSLGGALNGSNTSMSQIVSSAQATTQQMAKLKKGTVEARSEMEEFGRQSALAVRRFAAFNFATGAIFGLLNAVSKATTEFIEFDKQIVRLTQITGESYEQLSRITDTITGLSTGLGVASSDLIKISDTLAQAGFSARETDQALRALALTALAPSFENLNETVEGSIALMRQFKISTEDLDKALGSINAVAAGFAVEASDIITAIQRTGGVFAAASKGVSQGTDALNEFIAVFTSVRATTRESAETIATGLRTIFTRIQREDTIDALREYGVNLLDVEGKFVGAYKAVQLLSQGLSKLDPRDTSFSRIVEELGGFRQIGKVLPLIQEFATAQQALGVAQRGQSSLAQDAIKAQSSLAVQFSKTRESFVALIRDIGNSDSFKTLVSLGLTLANTFIRVADVAKPLLPIITAIGAIKGAKALTSFVGGFVGGLRKVKPTGDAAGGGAQDQAAAARSQKIADSYTDNSVALNNTTSALNNLTTAISPLTASIDNLGNGVMTQLLNEITSLNNNISNIPPGGPTLNRGGIVRKFARGGSVPGSGNTDSVPALLTPGEFVVNKKSARAVGSKNLHRINGYAKGGPIAANITDTTTSDGDTLNVNFTPEQKPFNTLSRLENWDAFETDDVPGFKIPEWQRKLGRAAAKVTSEEYNKQDNKALKAFKASNGAMDNYGRPMFKDDNLGSKLKNLGLAMPYKGKGKAPTKQLSTWGDYRNIFGYAPSQAPGLQGDNISEDDVVKKALGGMVQRFADGGWVKRMQQQSPEKLDGELGLLNSTLDLFGFQRKVPVSTFSKSSPFMEDAGIKEVRERISAIKEFLASKEPQKKKKAEKKAEKEITLPKAPSGISDHLRSLIEGNEIYDITRNYDSVVKQALNEAYRGNLGPGNKQQNMDKVGPKSIVSFAPDREYIDVSLGSLEKDILYIDKVKKLKGEDSERLAANKGYSVSDMLDTVRAYQAIGLDGALNPALGRKEDLSQSLADTSGLNKTERKKLGPAVDQPLSYFVGSLDAAMQFSLPEKLYSGIGASKQKLFIESAGVKVNKLEDTKKLVGKTVSIPSFLSTSEVPATAESFARTGMMTIETNKKSKGLSPERAKTDTINRDKSKTRKIDQRLISDSFGKGKADESFADDYDIESEYILPRNSKFKVKNIEANDNSEEGGNILESLNMDWAVKMLNAGGKVQKFAEGGVAQRKVGYIDYDVIANEANKDVVEKGMKETGSDGPRIYSDYLTKLAVNARKSANIQKLRAIYGVAGSGKTTLARGQGTDNARLRQTERFPILSPEDIDRATEILILTSSVSKTKMDDFFGDVDRAYTLSSTTSTERSRVKDQRGSRDVTGVGLEGRQPGTTMGVSTDTAVGEALLSDKLGDRSTVLGRSGSGRLRRKSGNELVDIIKKRIGFTWGGFAPTTAGHESIMDAAAAMGIPPEDFIALVGANEAVDPSSYRTAIFDQDARVLLAKAGFGAQGATVLPKPRDFEVPQGFDITQQGSDRRQVLIPGKGSTAFVADKTEDQTAKYKQAGYDVKSIERTGGISGTMVRDLIIAGDMAKLQSVLSPGVYDLVSNNIGRIQNRASVLPSLIEQAQKEAQAEMSQVDQQIEALGIKRIDSKKLESDPEYAAKVEVLKELRSKKQKMKSAAGFTPYKLLDALAQKDPENYALDFSAPAIMGNVPGMRVMGQNSQAPEAPMPVGRVAQLAQEKNKSIQEVILEQLGALGGPAGIKRILGIGSGDRTLSSLLQAGNIKGGKGLEQAADYVNKALSAKGIRDAAEAKRLEEYQAKALHFGIAGLLPMDYSKEFEWDIGGTDVYATARGFGSMYLEEARQMQKESSELAQRFAENVQNKNIFGGGENLAFDFDKTLVDGADILDAKGNPDIPQYSNRDSVKEALGKARTTRLADKLKSLIDQDPSFIKRTRILTARPQSTADLLASTLQRLGLPYSEDDITGVSGGASSNIASLKAANLQQQEKLIDDNLDNIRAAQKAGKKAFQYIEPQSTTSELDEKMGQGNIEGAIIEKALAVLGAPIRPDAKQNRAIDYPDGLGSAAQFFPGIDPGIPTEVKRTIDGSSLEKVREEIGSYLTGGAQAVKLAFGGRVQRFEVGGVAEPEQKKEKQYGKISITEDSGMISAGYLKSGTENSRQGYATAYKLRDNLYYVGLSSATDGYGPRLYDVLMEAVTEKGAMLTSDRSVVSGEARKVWEFYFKNRGDVKKTPLEPKDWTQNEALLDPKLYGRKEKWPPADDPAWVLQTGYSKSPNLIKGPDVVRPDAKPDSRAMALSYFAARTPKFANGGIVPGTGNRDTVPASLTAGDFVIRKSSVKKLGLGGSQGFASGGEVPALLTPGELVVPQAQAKKIGYGKLNTMNKYGRYNKGGAVGIQRFKMGGEAVTPAEMSIFRSSMAAVMATFSDEVSSAVDKIDLPTIDTSSWETMRKSLIEIQKVVRSNFATLGDDVVNSMRAMTSAGNKALGDIELERARVRQSEIASSRGYSSSDIDKMKDDVSDAKTGREATFGRKRKNAEREAEGRAPFEVLDLMTMMRSAVGGRQPTPINVAASTPTAPVEPEPDLSLRDIDFYSQRMNYSDVSGKDIPISGRGREYAAELADQDPGQVDALVKQLRDMFSTVMADVKTPSGKISAAGQSQSWANWDIGKQLFMSKNPDQSSDKYHLGNPMQDPKVMLQMVQRMVGYEVSGGKDNKGKNIPSFELVEIGAKAMAESLSKNEAALDAFVKTLSGLTREDIIGSTSASSAASAPAPPRGGGLGYPGSMQKAPYVYDPLDAPDAFGMPTGPTPSGAGGSGSPPKPPVPPTPPPSGGPNPGNAEAAVERYMAEMEAAAKAVKMQTYEAERLAGATASEAKARADAASQAAAQAIAQQRLVGATTEETIAIADAITRTSKVKGGGTLSRDDMKLPAQALARGGAPAPDNTGYAAATKANIDSINSMTESFTKFSFGLAASEGLGEFMGLIGSDSALGKTVNNLVSSLTSTSALFISANAAVSTFTSVLSSETTEDYLNNFSDYLTSASRTVEDFSAGFSGSAAQGILGRIASGLGSGSGMVSRLAGNLPQIASGVSGALSSLAGPVGLAITAFQTASSVFIGITDSLRQSKLDASIKAFDDNLKYAEQALDSYSKNTVDNAGQLQIANTAIMNAAREAKTQSDITSTNPKWSTTNIIGESLALGGGGAESRAQRSDILDKKGMMAYIGSLIDVTGITQSQYTKELIPQKAAETAEKFKKPAELQQRVFEQRFKKGESSSDIMKSPDWKQQAEILARSNAETEQQLRSIDADISLSKQARDAKRQELISLAAANSIRDQEVKYIRNRNSEQANNESAKLLYGLDRMLGNMEQSISSVTYAMNKLADQTDLLKASMTGDAKIGASRIDAGNVLQNPNMYSADERSRAADVGSQFFGPQAQDMKGLLQFGPDLENTILSTINRTIQEDPGASSGKIEARISQNIERDLGNLNIDEALKKTLSKDISSALSDSQKKGEDKIDYQQVFGEASAFGKTVQATKKAQEAAVKALEFYQQSVNNYAQSMNEAVALQMSSNEKMRRADDIRVRGEMTLAKTLGKSISLESSKSAANAGVMSQAGTSDPREIMNNIGRLEMTRQSQQASVDASAQRGPRGSKDLMAFTSQLSGTTMQLRDNYAALKSLADSTEVADAALAKMSEVKAKNEAGLGILERFISSTPKEQNKLNQSFERLDRNMNGQTNNMWDSIRVQEAYNEALKNGGSMQDAQEAADQAAAQDRGDTMEAFKMLAPYLGDNQNQLKANMLQSMMSESGVEMSPMFNQVLEGLRNPESDPQMAAALNEYKIANDLQVQANKYLAMLDGTLAQQIGAQAQVAFSNALSGVQQSIANANAKDTLQGINNLNGHLRSGVTKVTTVSSGTREAPDIPGMAKGGVVEYLAVGGSIFQPKGTDTVPAMLTPGEFVVNKSAASSNGPLLNAINNGYSKGGSVKYYADGGWVSSMLRPETDRFSDSTDANPLYTKFNDFSTFGDPKSVIKNLEGLKADEGLLQFIRPYSYPLFNGTDSDLFQSAMGDMEGPLNKQIGSSQLGILPDFYLSRQVVNKALKGAGYGAAAGAMVQGATSNVMGFGAGSLGSVGATAAATANNDTGSSLSGYLWEAMKFVPGLGGVISGIDAVRALMKGDLLGGVLEGLSAVMNLIPIPGAGVVGKGITKALGWSLKWIPGFRNIAAAGGKLIPGIFQKFAPGIYDKLAGFLNGNLLDVIMKFIPGPIKKRLGMAAWRGGASSATEAMSLGTQTAANASRNALKYAVPGLAGAGAVVGAGQALYEGATPVEEKGVPQKLKELTALTNIKYPEQFSKPNILSDLITKNTDALSLEEAKKQAEIIKPWADSLKEADQWEKVKDIPSAKVKVKKGAYTQYDFGSEINTAAKEYMYARVGKGDVLPENLFPTIGSETGLLRFTTSGYPTLKASDPNVSASTDSYLSSTGRSFKPEGLSGGNEDFGLIYKELQDYYEDLSEINPIGTTSDKYDAAFWTPKAPAQQKESKRNSILSALVDGSKLKYSFDKKDLVDTSLFKWGTSDVKPPDGSKPAEENTDKLTVYGKAVRTQWADMIKGEIAEKAVKDKRIWGGDPATAFTVSNSLDNAQVEPLPWTTSESFFSQEMMQALQKQHETDLRKKIGLKVSPSTSYNKLVDLPSSKGKLPVYFDFQNFESIPLLNLENTEFTDSTPKSFLPDGMDTAGKGLFIKNRAVDRNGVVNPFQMLSQGATEYPYFSSESALDAAVQQWAISNFDLPDFSLAGIKLATMYNPIVAEKAFKPSSSIKSARTSRRSGDVKSGDDASDAAKLLLGKEASESLLFYSDDYKIGDEIPYSDAKNIIMGKLPGLADAMQKNAVRDMTMTKDEKRKRMQAAAAKVAFKPEQVPLLANKVWQKTKTTDIPMTNGLRTASDWISAASEDGMSPPEEIKNQTKLLDAIDYISWIKSKVLSVTEKARSQSKEKLAEVQNMATETAFGKYISAGRFMSQLSSQSENVGGSNTTISQASERLYSKYGSELDKWTTKEKIVTTSVKGADAKGVSIGDKSKAGGDQKFWNIPKIIDTDASFVDFILGFAQQQRGAQRFDQLITGNGNAKLTDVQTNAIGGIYEKFTGQAQALTDDKSGTKGVMKAMVGGETVDVALPSSIADVKAQFMDDNTVYPPEYRDVLGDTLMQLGDRYATKWASSGDPGTEEWSTLWADYSDKLSKLKEFLVYRDELLIRPIAVNKEDKLYPPAVMPAITGSMIPTMVEGAKKAGLPVPEIDMAALQASIPDPVAFSQYLKDNVFKIAGVGTGAEDYKARDSISAALATVDTFYNDNFAPTALPRVFTEEGNTLWQILEKLYPDANTAYSTFSGGVVGEGSAASDTTVQLKSLAEIYDKNTMPSAQPTMYGLAYNTNKKFGTNNTIEAIQREKEAGTPKPEVSADSVATQAAANAGSMPDVGVPPDASRSQVEQVAGGEEQKPQEPVTRAKGGLIYRAVGGPAPVNWTPRGTDSVPAMLTPGEYVINRSSTQKYLPILEAINNGNSSQGAIAAAVQAGGVPATSYASRGGVISPRYFDRGGGVTSASGVSNSYSMGFDSATLAAIKQFDTSVQAFGEALSQLNIGSIKLDEAALTALGDFATRFDQFTQSLLKLNVPPVISITGQHDVNVNLNGAAVFSTMEERMQTMILDEIDKAFGQLSKDNEGGISTPRRSK